MFQKLGIQVQLRDIVGKEAGLLRTDTENQSPLPHAENKQSGVQAKHSDAGQPKGTDAKSAVTGKDQRETEKINFVYFQEEKYYDQKHVEEQAVVHGTKKRIEEVRSIENADLLYVVQTFKELHRKQPKHYRIKYLSSLMTEAIDQFMKKSVLNKVQTTNSFDLASLTLSLVLVLLP